MENTDSLRTTIRDEILFHKARACELEGVLGEKIELHEIIQDKKLNFPDWLKKHMVDGVLYSSQEILLAWNLRARPEKMLNQLTVSIKLSEAIQHGWIVKTKENKKNKFRLKTMNTS